MIFFKNKTLLKFHTLAFIIINNNKDSSCAINSTIKEFCGLTKAKNN